jgi:hypothetical protein
MAGNPPPYQPWGVKSNRALLPVESRTHQRCILSSVRAATDQLAGAIARCRGRLPALGQPRRQRRADQCEESALRPLRGRPCQSPRPSAPPRPCSAVSLQKNKEMGSACALSKLQPWRHPLSLVIILIFTSFVNAGLAFQWVSTHAGPPYSRTQRSHTKRS